jgi:hypothetical protein
MGAKLREITAKKHTNRAGSRNKKGFLFNVKDIQNHQDGKSCKRIDVSAH